MGVGLLALPFVLPAAAAADAVDMPKRRLELAYFGEPFYRPKGSTQSYFLIAGSDTAQSGYVFFPKEQYTALQVKYGDYDAVSETVRDATTASCTPRKP